METFSEGNVPETAGSPESHASFGPFGTPGSAGNSPSRDVGADLDELKALIMSGFSSMNQRMDKMDERIDKLDEKMDKMDQRIDKLDEKMDKMDQRIDKLDEKMDKMDGRMSRVESRLEGVENRLEGMGNRLEGMENRLEDECKKQADFRGDMYERTLREEVSKAHGSSFARHFVITGLSGLARMTVTPKRVSDCYSARDFGVPLPEHDNSDIQNMQSTIRIFLNDIHSKDAPAAPILLGMIADELSKIKSTAQYAHDFRNAILFDTDGNSDRKRIFACVLMELKKLRANLPGEVAYVNVWIKVCEFALLPKQEQQVKVQDDAGIGFLLFTSKACPEYFPKISLEFDCRGTVVFLGAAIEVKVGEIKSSLCNWQKAMKQLDLRGLVLSRALNLLYPAAKVYCTGYFFCPKSCQADFNRQGLIIPPGVLVEFL